MSRPLARTCAALTTALLTVALVLAATPASAHVTVSTPDGEAGGFGKIVFRVPSESETASTTKILITLPESTPFAFVSAQTKPGWTLDVREAELPEPVEAGDTTLSKAVRTVTWTSSGDGIAPGEFDEFALSAGPFPKVRSMSFAAEQTYDDGEVVAWDQPAKEGEDEPERPAPVLAVGAPADTRRDADRTAAAVRSDDSPDLVARGLAGAALVAAVGAALVSLRQNRRRA